MKGSQKEKQRELSEFVSDIVFDEFYKYKFATLKDQLYFYYNGEYKVAEINEKVQVDVDSGKTTTHKSYDLHTSRAAGSESTPYFKEPFEENTAISDFDWRLTIHVPDNLVEESRLVIDVDYDIGWWDQISISHFGGENFISFHHRD